MNSRPVRENLLSSLDTDGKLLAHRCASCSQVFFPRASEICLKCLHDQLDEIELSSKGTLYTFTVSDIPSKHFKAPYTCGFVTLPEGVRVFAPLHPDSDSSALETGMEVDLVVGEAWKTDEESIVAYHFQPAG